MMKDKDVRKEILKYLYERYMFFTIITFLPLLTASLPVKSPIRSVKGTVTKLSDGREEG